MKRMRLGMIPLFLLVGFGAEAWPGDPKEADPLRQVEVPVTELEKNLVKGGSDTNETQEAFKKNLEKTHEGKETTRTLCLGWCKELVGARWSLGWR